MEIAFGIAAFVPVAATRRGIAALFLPRNDTGPRQVATGGIVRHLL